LGYVGFACDMFGKGVRGEVTGDNSALIAPFLQDRAMLRARLVATVKVVRALPEVDPNNVAAIGFCFGGSLVFSLIFVVFFRQTPEVFDAAKPHKHFLVLFVDRRPFGHAESLDHVSMGAMKDDERIHAAELPGADVFTGDMGGVVHDVRVVDGEDTIGIVCIRPQHRRQHVGDAGSLGRFVEP